MDSFKKWLASYFSNELKPNNMLLFLAYHQAKSDAMPWISVKDNLPKIGDFVLLCDEHGCVHTGCREDDEEWFSVTTDLRVIHWMPLPTPPFEVQP